MRIQNEIENVERVKEKIATMPLTMEDAIEFHKKVVERVQKERKDINKELGIGDIEKDGFTGRIKNFKTSTPELKKMKLSESLFKPLNENWVVVTRDKDDDSLLDGAVFNSLSNAKKYLNQLRAEEPEYNYSIEEVDPRSSFADEEPLDESLNEELEVTDGWGDEIEYILSETFSELENLMYEVRNCRRSSYTNCETAEELADYIHRLAEDLDECSYEIKANSKNINESLNEDDSGSNFVQQAEEEEKERRAEEEKKRKEEEEKEKRDRLKDKVWAEKDWVAEKAKAAGEGKELDLSKYSKEEQDAINQGFEDFANDETAQAQYLRKKEKEMKDAAEKAKQEKKNARKELFGYSGDKEDITKAIGNVGKAIAGMSSKIGSELRKSGMHNINL